MLLRGQWVGEEAGWRSRHACSNVAGDGSTVASWHGWRSGEIILEVCGSRVCRRRSAVVGMKAVKGSQWELLEGLGMGCQWAGMRDRLSKEISAGGTELSEEPRL